MRVRSGLLAQYPAVVVASEKMDEDPRWSAMKSGELLHVDDQLRSTRSVVLDAPPAHRIALDELDEQASASQRGK